MQILIALCGDVEVGGIALPGPERVVLAALVLAHPGGLSRDQLAEVLWPDEQPRTWASAMRTYVSRARSTLARALPADADDPLLHSAGTYRLTVPAGIELITDLDLAAREITAARQMATSDPAGAARRTDAVVTCLRAPILPLWPGPWAEDLRTRADELVATACEVASASLLATGDAAGALAAADASMARAPLRESVHRARWAALAAGGNRAEALRDYHRLRRTLADELGVDPAPETEAAYLDLLGDEPGEPGRPAPAGATTTLPFVGRERELAALDDAWRLAAAGPGQLVVVTGEAGVGKSRLTAEAARRTAGVGGRVLLGRCDDEPIVPYQPLVEALDCLVDGVADGDAPPVGPMALAELGAVLPSLAGRPAATGGRAGLFTALADLVQVAARERPLMLVLDDLQWADRDTLLAIRHLVRQVHEAQLLVVAIARDHEGRSSPLDDMVRELVRDGRARPLRLAGLAETDLRELVSQVAPAAGPDAPGRLMAETGGNPFLVGELLRAGYGRTDAIPTAVQDLVRHRVACLEGDARALIRAACVAGTRFELDLVADVAGLDGEKLLDAVDRALASGLIVEDSGERHRFRHDIMRRAVVAQLSDSRRRALHRGMAEAIERLRAAELDRQAARLAHHYAASARPAGDKDAVRWSRTAAAQAYAHHAPSQGLRLRRQAEHHLPAGDGALAAAVAAELGDALISAGETDAAVAALVDAAALGIRHGEAGVAARAALALADAAASRADRADLDAEARRLVTDTARIPDLDDLSRGRLLAQQARWCDGAPPPALVAQVSDTVVGALASALDGWRGPAARDGRTRLAGDLALLAALAGERSGKARAAHEQAMVAATTGDRSGLDRAMAALAEVATVEPMAAVAVAEREVAQWTAEGAFADAERALAATVALREAWAGEVSAQRTAARHRALLGWLACAAPGDGDSGGAADVLAQLRDGRPERAAARLRAVVADLRTRPEDDVTLHELGLAALGAVALAGEGAGDAATVAELRARLGPYSDLVCGVGYRTFAGAAAFHLGRLAAVAGDWAEAERDLGAALRLHTAWRARPWVAMTQRSLADVLAARGRPGDRELIANLQAEATRAVERLGMRP